MSINNTDFPELFRDYVEAKPAPEPYLTGLQRFGAKPEQSVAIEDSARGMKAAIAANLDCIIVRNAFTEAHDFSGAWRFVDSIRDVPAVLEV